MRIKKAGFTLVEIALFLAITGLIFVGVMVGTGNSIAQQRFNDSVQNFTELLRTTYSEVSNPQSVGEGRADVAIYGKLISFGQKTGLDGKPLADQKEQRIFIYDVVGDVNNVNGGPVEEVLKELGANVAVVTATENGKVTEMGPAGEIKSYIPRWGASIEKTDRKLFTGSILIVRHPKSGTINTLVLDKTIEVNQILVEANKNKRFAQNDPINTLLTSVLSGFTTQEIDFCINPSGVDTSEDNRRDIRLVRNARNASGVELIDLDLDLLDSNKEQIGNRCRFKSGKI